MSSTCCTWTVAYLRLSSPTATSKSKSAADGSTAGSRTASSAVDRPRAAGPGRPTCGYHILEARHRCRLLNTALAPAAQASATFNEAFIMNSLVFDPKGLEPKVRSRAEAERPAAEGLLELGRRARLLGRRRGQGAALGTSRDRAAGAAAAAAADDAAAAVAAAVVAATHFARWAALACAQHCCNRHAAGQHERV